MPSRYSEHLTDCASGWERQNLMHAEAGRGPAVRPAIALADYGLDSAVKMAVACALVGVDHLCGMRLRMVPEASWHPWAEKPCELLLYAGDEEAWLAQVALHNRGHLSGADLRGARSASDLGRLAAELPIGWDTSRVGLPQARERAFGRHRLAGGLSLIARRRIAGSSCRDVPGAILLTIRRLALGIVRFLL